MSSMLPILLTAILILWTWAQQRLRAASQPLRLQLAERGEKLLGDPQLPTHLRQHVSFLLETAFSSRGVLIFGLVAVPVILLVSIVNPVHFQKSLAKRFTINNGETQLNFEEVNKLHSIITFSNHPILATLLDFEIAIFRTMSLAAIGLIYGKVPATSSTISVKAIVEAKEQEYRSLFRLHFKAA